MKVAHVTLKYRNRPKDVLRYFALKSGPSSYTKQSVLRCPDGPATHSLRIRLSLFYPLRLVPGSQAACLFCEIDCRLPALSRTAFGWLAEIFLPGLNGECIFRILLAWPGRQSRRQKNNRPSVQDYRRGKEKFKYFIDMNGMNKTEGMTVEEVMRRDKRFRYMLLARLQSDCEYYLGFGNRSTGRLWAGDEARQIEWMTRLYDGFPEDEKPRWLTREEIAEYANRMLVDR